MASTKLASKSSKSKASAKPAAKAKPNGKPNGKLEGKAASAAKALSKALLAARAVKIAKAPTRRRRSARRGQGERAKGRAAKTAGAGKRIYFFGGGKAEGNKEMKNLLGGKGANLAEMTNIGLPVPPGFTITTEVCTEFYTSGRKLPKALDDEMRAADRQDGEAGRRQVRRPPRTRCWSRSAPARALRCRA